MKHIKEYFNTSGDPVVSVYSFDSNGLVYMVDVLLPHYREFIFRDKKQALDYAQAMTNRINKSNQANKNN